MDHEGGNVYVNGNLVTELVVGVPSMQGNGKISKQYDVISTSCAHWTQRLTEDV